jgi:hypothetical protein
MKNKIGILLFVSLFAVVSCQKEVIVPNKNIDTSFTTKQLKKSRGSGEKEVVEGPGITDPNNDPDANKRKPKG